MANAKVTNQTVVEVASQNQTSSEWSAAQRMGCDKFVEEYGTLYRASYINKDGENKSCLSCDGVQIIRYREDVVFDNPNNLVFTELTDGDSSFWVVNNNFVSKRELLFPNM